MFKILLGSFLLALANIRARFFHTLLSVLGIVIGVASLVSILSLIDGMEKFANEQISKTTSLNAIIIRSDLYKKVNEVRVKKDTFSIMDYEHFRRLTDTLTLPARTFLRSTFASEVALREGSKSTGAGVTYSSASLLPDAEAAPGTLFTENDLNEKAMVAVVNRAFMNSLSLGSDSLNLIGKTVVTRGKEFKIVGILKGNLNKIPEIFVPFSIITPEEMKSSLPDMIIEARTVENVKGLKEQAETWLKNNYPGKEDFTLITNEFRVKQLAQGFLIFRVVMGLIVGISVLVGGIGVMNVLLISVNERTVEIGLRKAVGANRRDIMLQFLSESVTVSAFGSFLGVVLGVLGTMIAIPIVKAITEAPFQAAYTANTMLVIAIVALAVGILFGTYPAMRASRLDPVEAMRHE